MIKNLQTRGMAIKDSADLETRGAGWVASQKKYLPARQEDIRIWGSRYERKYE